MRIYIDCHQAHSDGISQILENSNNSAIDIYANILYLLYTIYSDFESISKRIIYDTQNQSLTKSLYINICVHGVWHNEAHQPITFMKTFFSTYLTFKNYVSRYYVQCRYEESCIFQRISCVQTEQQQKKSLKIHLMTQNRACCC